MDTITAYYRRVAEQLNKAMGDKGISQKHLAKECKSRFGIEISQSTISKILHSEGGHMSAVFVCAMCQVLDIGLPGVLGVQEADHGGDGESAAFPPMDGRPEPGVRETLLYKPTDSAFFGYIDRIYDIFFWSTGSSENKLICGTMELSNEGDEYCKVHIRLDTGRHPVKEYVGRMAISLQQHACYCTVESRRLGERCSFVFYHRFFSQGAMQARLATVTTVSTGDSRRPTAHRMAICEKNAVDSEQKKDFVAAQLLLNNSQIIIPEEKMGQLRQDGELRPLLEKLERPGKPYYVFDESEIRMLPNQDFLPLANAISTLRLHSVAQHYNKVGGKADELLYKYLFKYTVREDAGEE